MKGINYQGSVSNQEIFIALQKIRIMNQDNNHSKSQINDLFLGEEEEILSNLESLRDSGNLESLGAMLEHLTTLPSHTIKGKILELIADLKLPGAAAIVANFTFACKNATLQQELVSASWQSRLDFTPYFNRYIDLAISGNLMLVLDVLSLIEENFEKVDLNQLQQAIATIGANSNSLDEQKSLLMNDMILILEEKANALKE